jgi:beta-lactamase regulating signal transducer with metallopeptidase domain
MLWLQNFIESLAVPFIPLLDVTLKGTAVLLLSGGVCLVLRRDSAATRHLVWATAVLLVLAMPLFEVVLPQWRVLPGWPQVAPDVATASRPEPKSIAREGQVADTAREPRGVDVTQPRTDALAPRFVPATAVTVGDELPVAVTRGSHAESGASGRGSVIIPPATSSADSWLIVIWLTGSCLILLRLLVAVFVLHKSARLCRLVSAVGSEPAHANAGDQSGERTLRLALDAAATRLGVTRSVKLLLDPQPSMPVVWGLWRPRLRLPAEAMGWSDQQLQSVLLHELAHIRRHDLVILTLTQLACALNWFNPLLWYAAWRLHVERELACDDLVLGAGMKPSAYAEHLVEIVSRLLPAVWARSCGLAMARSSFLESRLKSILSRHINRRGVTRLAVTAIPMIGLLISIPVAMLHATDRQGAPAASPADGKKGAEKKGDGKKGAGNEPPGTKVKVVAQPVVDKGTKLDSVIEEKLQWGKPENGLRGALIRPQALGELDAGEHMDLRLVLQNVSEKPIRLRRGFFTQETRLLVRMSGELVMMIADGEPKPAEFLVQPREVAVLRLFPERNAGRSITDERGVTFSVELKIENTDAKAWTGKLDTTEMTAPFAGFGLLPKHKGAHAVFRMWCECARGNGNIPGALIGHLAAKIQVFMKNNPTSKATPPLNEILPRLDANRDWTGPEAIALLDDVAELHLIPIDLVSDNEHVNALQTGKPLPPGLADAPWGAALSNGLRLLWLLEPRAAEYRLGTALKARAIFHNSGKTPVVFRAWTFNQPTHHAFGAQGGQIELESTHWLTLGRLVPHRLAPGESTEVYVPGIAVGARKGDNDDDWQNARVGTWVNAQEGDVVTLSTDPLHLATRREERPGEENSNWWVEYITSRLERHLPLPDGAEERQRLLYRISMELFGTPVGDKVATAFIADNSPGALESLAKALAQQPLCVPYSGELDPGSTTFRVLPRDPDAAKRPRTASNPGRYKLDDTVVLAVTRRPIGERIVNEAHVQFYAKVAGQPEPGPPIDVKLPDGYGTWAIAWIKGGTTFWLEEKAGIRKYDFSNPAKVIETPVDTETVAEDVKRALKAAVKE